MRTHYERMDLGPVAPVLTGPKTLALLKEAIDKGRGGEFPFAIWSLLGDSSLPTPEIARGFTMVVRSTIKALMDRLPDPYSYSLLCRDPQYGALFERLASMSSRIAIHPSLMCDYHGLTFERAGKRAYDVHPDLAERLVHTELRGLNADDLRLPYEAVYLMVPPSAGLKVWNDTTDWHEVEGIYLVEDHHMQVDSDIGQPTGPELRGWRVMVVGAPKGKAMVGGLELDDDALTYFRVFLPEGKSLDDCIAMTVQEIDRSTLKGQWTRKAIVDWAVHFRWAMNAVLYCTWEDRGEHWEANKDARLLWDRIQKLPKGSSKRAGLLERAKGVARQPRLRLGYRQITVNRHAAKQDNDTKSGVFQVGPGVRTRVSGHWRRQAHGPGRLERRLTWIEPYWRNLDGVVEPNEPVHVVR